MYMITYVETERGMLTNANHTTKVITRQIGCVCTGVRGLSRPEKSYEYAIILGIFRILGLSMYAHKSAALEQLV